MGTARGTRLSLVLCAALAAGGCGAGHTKTGSKTSTATQTQSATKKTLPSPLARRVLHDGELAGMTASPPPMVERNLAVWVAGSGFPAPQQSAEMARLRHLGWEAGIGENLVTPGNPNRFGLSLLEEFATHGSAEAQLAHEAGPSAPGGPWSYFPVHGIPGARGFEGIGTQSGRNVAFVDGSFYYLEGAGWNAPASNAVSRAQLTAAALLIYRRALGKPTGYQHARLLIRRIPGASVLVVAESMLRVDR